ncbi:MAG: ECF transporter S component [Vallitalea sp.]|jgi:riboflavin transporter FmnP|nr:ECF transporter S component [Vallitalea sp.]
MERVEKYFSSNKTNNRFNTMYLVKVSLLSAISYIVFLLDFPLMPYFPPFLQIDFSEIVVILGGITLGPLAAVTIEFLKAVLRFILMNSGTGGIGEFANFIVGIAYVLPFCIIYRRNNLKRFIIGSLLAIASITIVGALVNYFINIPVYSKITDHTVKMDMVLTIYTPFNLIKGTIISIANYIVLKAFTPVINILAK